jgi:hypothetical protein
MKRRSGLIECSAQIRRIPGKLPGRRLEPRAEKDCLLKGRREAINEFGETFWVDWFSQRLHSCQPCRPRDRETLAISALSSDQAERHTQLTTM